MFGLLTRSSCTRPSLARRTTILRLERLEDRLSPASVGGEALSMNVSYLPNKNATFSGQLTNKGVAVANETIKLSGVVTASTSTDSQGNYSITLSIPRLGSEQAVSADGLSNIALVTLQGGNPTINNFTALNMGNGVWLFSGRVTGAPTQGEVVNFSGIIPLQGQSTAVNSDGSFEFSATVPSDGGGTASAQAVDWWGDTSSTVKADVDA